MDEGDGLRPLLVAEGSGRAQLSAHGTDGEGLVEGLQQSVGVQLLSSGHAPLKQLCLALLRCRSTLLPLQRQVKAWRSNFSACYSLSFPLALLPLRWPVHLCVRAGQIPLSNFLLDSSRLPAL